MNASHSARPGSPCSNIMRAYSFSITIGLRKLREKKIRHAGAAAAEAVSQWKLGSKFEEAGIYTAGNALLQESGIIQCQEIAASGGLTATKVPTTASNATHPNQGKFLMRPEKVAARPRTKSIIA